MALDKYISIVSGIFIGILLLIITLLMLACELAPTPEWIFWNR